VRYIIGLGNSVMADDGVGLPPDIDPATTPSMGFQVVRLLAEQLDASLEVDRNGGTRIRICVPQAAPTAPPP